MMAIHGWSSYLRDVLKVLAIHRNFPTRVDRHSINMLGAGSPSNRCCRSVARRADGSGSRRLKRVPTGSIEGPPWLEPPTRCAPSCWPTPPPRRCNVAAAATVQSSQIFRIGQSRPWRRRPTRFASRCLRAWRCPIAASSRRCPHDEGSNPTHEANCRADLNVQKSPTAATRAEAVRSPTPGIC